MLKSLWQLTVQKATAAPLELPQHIQYARLNGSSQQSAGLDIRKFSLARFPKFSHFFNTDYIDGLVHDCSISIAKALEILQSCTKPSIYDLEDNFAQIHLSDWQF